MNPLLVLALFIAPAQEPAAPSEAAVDAAIAKGVRWLIDNQYPDGSWTDWMEQSYPAGPTALAAYALFKSGLPPEHRSLVLALDFLDRHPPFQTYDAALRVLLLTSMDPERFGARIERAADVFFDHHPGRYHYTHVLPNQPGGDLSNAQFAVVAMEALDRNGWQRDNRFWRELAEFFEKDQLSDGGFPYHAGGRPTITMTLAGFGCLSAARRVLAARGERQSTLDAIDRTLARAEEWLGGTWLGDQKWEGGNGLNRWGYYAWYGMERGAALSGKKMIGGHDWYADACRILLAKQGGGGAWANPWGEKEINTSFALLTLSRATAHVNTGGEPRPGLWVRRWTNVDDGKADLLITAAGLPHCTAFLAGFHREVVELYANPGEPRPRILRFSWWLDGEEIQVVRPEDPAAMAAAQAAPRFPLEFDLRENRDLTLEARAWLALPGSDDPADLVQVSSGPLVLNVRGLVTEDDRRLAAWLDRAWPIDASAMEQLTASSEHDGRYNAAVRAFDRVGGSRWLATAEDPEPWIRLAPKRNLRVAAIRLLPAWSGPDQAGFDLPARIRVTVNGRKHELTMARTDVREGVELSFRRPLRLRELEVRVLEKLPPVTGAATGRTGFREILLLDEEKKGRKK
ncbi:MAG: hypothetical protein D6702_00985 [Planctomycetota bacterium]|nr:MAG: hypothetical protein D6702_00985 [Planctomycetota bacterium]